MSDTLIVALISLAGTLLGSLGGIVASGKLTNYRLEALEARVEGLTELIERTHDLEKKESVSEERLRLLDRRVVTLENNAYAN